MNTDRTDEIFEGPLSIYLGVITVLLSSWWVFFGSHCHLEIHIEVFPYSSHPVCEGASGIRMDKSRRSWQLSNLRPGSVRLDYTALSTSVYVENFL